MAGVANTTVESVNDGKQAAWFIHQYLQVLQSTFFTPELTFYCYNYVTVEISPIIPKSVSPRAVRAIGAVPSKILHSG